jgi:hypothetical protein
MANLKKFGKCHVCINDNTLLCLSCDIGNNQTSKFQYGFNHKGRLIHA